MDITNGINPNNKNQARIFFCMYEALENNENRNPCTVMNELAVKLNFKIIGKVPQTLFDGWDFWIEFENKPELPNFFRKGIKWKGIGQA